MSYEFYCYKFSNLCSPLNVFVVVFFPLKLHFLVCFNFQRANTFTGRRIIYEKCAWRESDQFHNCTIDHIFMRAHSKCVQITERMSILQVYCRKKKKAVTRNRQMCMCKNPVFIDTKGLLHILFLLSFRIDEHWRTIF